MTSLPKKGQTLSLQCRTTLDITNGREAAGRGARNKQRRQPRRRPVERIITNRPVSAVSYLVQIWLGKYKDIFNLFEVFNTTFYFFLGSIQDNRKIHVSLRYLNQLWIVCTWDTSSQVASNLSIEMQYISLNMFIASSSLVSSDGKSKLAKIGKTDWGLFREMNRIYLIFACWLTWSLPSPS